MTFTYDELKAAYTKLKSYVYYDSSNLFMRKQLANFETFQTDPGADMSGKMAYVHFRKHFKITHEKNKETIFEQKLRDICHALNYHEEYPKFWDTFLGMVRPQFIPKKLSGDERSKIITNKRVSEKYEASRTTIFIDAPIEVHLLSVLWILRRGVELDSQLYDGCLGNRLILTKNKDHVVQGSGLFKPYPRQYQKWRDDSVAIARERLDAGENVMLLNLDVKDYFYSVRIPVSQLSPRMKHERDESFHQLFEQLHINFTRQLAATYRLPYDFMDEVADDDTTEEKVILPIGLLSSFVLANHYLKDFDERILQRFKPAYYGRYVDDILMVITNPQVPAKVDGQVGELNFDLPRYKEWLQGSDLDPAERKLEVESAEELTDLELFVLENFNNIICLIDRPEFLNTGQEKLKDERLFKLRGYQRLYCQSEKTLLHYFDAEESELVIDKLKKDLEEKSSEFRNYDSSDNEEDFEKSAYHLLYDGSSHKIRTLKDYKEDRFGISVYLSKKIHGTLKVGDKISEKEAQKLIKLFKGANALNFYTLWEKVFTFLLVNNKPAEYVNFYTNCADSVLRLVPKPGTIEVRPEDYRRSLLEHLDAAHEMALALQPQFLPSKSRIGQSLAIFFNRMKQKHEFFVDRDEPTLEDSPFLYRFRDANLIRHHFVSQPLINYCSLDEEDSYRFIQVPFDQFVPDREKFSHSPRRIKYWECCTALFFAELGRYQHVDVPVIEEDRVADAYHHEGKHYLNEAFDLYKLANGIHMPSTATVMEKGLSAFFERKPPAGDPHEGTGTEEFHFHSGGRKLSPKIAVCNTIVKESNIKLSLRGRANTDKERFDTLSQIFQQTKVTDADILLFPECFIPAALLSNIVSFAVKEQIMTVTGLEHITVGGYSFNYIVTILPFERDGIKDAAVIYRLKNHYSHAEEMMIKTNHFRVPRPMLPLYQLFIWKGIYFSPYYCFEIANVQHRSLFKGKIDLLIACEWNQDVNYFSNIVESISRDLHVYVAQVNTSQYGDTRLTRPAETARKDILKLKGGTNDTVLVGVIDIEKLREFQRELYMTTKDDKLFKPLPPDFRLKDILNRIEHRSVL